MRAWLWFLIDTGWFLLTVASTVVAAVALVATPLWLGMIHRELVTIHRDMNVTVVDTCDCGDGCRCEDRRKPILPRVLPRLRRIGEGEKPADADVTTCSNCGTEWHHMTPGPHGPIDHCPECPMSDEEFQALQKAARERKAK